MHNITIIGAGMAGLLAGNVLKKQNPKIIEAAPSLPSNHSAVLRFRSSVVSDTLGIPFDRVKVSKGSVPWKNPIADSMSYSYKTNGTYRSDRSIVTTSNESVDRYIAPQNLISLMAEGLDIKFSKKFKKPSNNDDPIISTIPMPALMDILDYRYKPFFNTVTGFNITATLPDTWAHFSLYVPHPEIAFNRISITGDQLIIEYSYPLCPLDEVKECYNTLISDETFLYGHIRMALEMCGIDRRLSEAIEPKPKVKMQQYSKILPIDESERKTFISWASEFHNVYSLGRYAVWKPGLLLDDLVNDIRLIEKWITRSDSYSRRKHSIKGEK